MPSIEEIEEIFLSVWSKVLGIEKIGMSDDFFDLGGDSMNAMSVIARLQKEHGIGVSMKIFVDNPTIAEMARAIHSLYD